MAWSRTEAIMPSLSKHHGSLSLYELTSTWRYIRAQHCYYRCLCTLNMIITAHVSLPISWWRHQMETFSALLTLCAGNSPVPVNSPYKGQWRGALMFSLISVWTNGWVNNCEAGDLRLHCGHYDVTVMMSISLWFIFSTQPTIYHSFALNTQASGRCGSNFQKGMSKFSNSYQEKCPENLLSNYLRVSGECQMPSGSLIVSKHCSGIRSMSPYGVTRLQYGYTEIIWRK